MIPRKMSMFAIASFLLAFNPDHAWSQRLKETGADHITNNNKALELDEGHTVFLQESRGITSTADPTSPTNNTVIDCFGFGEQLPNEGWKASGWCVITDKDGDKMFQRYSENGERGTFETIGGTGKFEGAKGGGTTAYTEIVGGLQNRGIIRWESETEFPKLKR